MSFDDLFILPNEDTTQSGGHEPFMILNYTGSDTLTKRPELPLTKPYILVKKEVPTTSLDTLEGYETTSGLSENDIMAVSGDAFLQILENQRTGGGLEKHLFFNPNNAAILPIEEVLGEQVIFLAMFHELYFLASINKLGLPVLNTPINDRFDGLKTLLKDEQITKTVFGIPHKDLSAFFTEIQTNYVGDNDARQKSFVDMCELILGEPTDILKYFKDAVGLLSTPEGNAGTAYTGANTRRGFNSISLASGTQAGNDEGAGVGATGTAVPTATGTATEAAVPVATGTATAAVPTATGNAKAAVTATKETGNGNNAGSVRTLGREGAEGKEGEDGEGKEGEDDGESKEDEGNGASATGSSSSGNPHSVAASATSSAQEGKEGEGEDEDVEFGPVNARITAAVPSAQKVKPPTLPKTNTTRNTRHSRQAALAAKKHGPNTFATSIGEQGNNENGNVKPHRFSRKKGKKGKKEKKTELSQRAATNNTTAAVYGPGLEEEVVSNNESEEGYNTTAAVAPTRGKSKSVGFRSISTAVNATGLESVVATGKK